MVHEGVARLDAPHSRDKGDTGAASRPPPQCATLAAKDTGPVRHVPRQSRAMRGPIKTGRRTAEHVPRKGQSRRAIEGEP